jgi:hypothetical protein
MFSLAISSAKRVNFVGDGALAEQFLRLDRSAKSGLIPARQKVSGVELQSDLDCPPSTGDLQ